jgi:hypothetical protein
MRGRRVRVKSDKPSIKTDFNDLADGYATALVSGRVPDVGAIVELFDADGNTCLARVERVENGVLYMQPFWETWKDGGYVPDLLAALRESVREVRARGDFKESKTAADPVKFRQYA